MSDFAKRELGQKSSLALDGLEISIWKRACETMRQAEAELDAGTLTPERAQALLISLLEQRKLVNQLRNQIEEGLRAGHRIGQQVATQTQVEERARERAAHGGNRFVRSRVVMVPPEDAAS